MTELFDLILSSHGYLSRFDKRNYPVCFSEFETAAADLFDRLEEDSEGTEAGTLLDKFASRYDSMNRWEKKDSLLKDRQVLALFLTPAALRHGDKAAAFAEDLCGLWKERFPKYPYMKGDYDSIMRGFEGGIMGFILRR